MKKLQSWLVTLNHNFSLDGMLWHFKTRIDIANYAKVLFLILCLCEILDIEVFLSLFVFQLINKTMMFLTGFGCLETADISLVWKRAFLGNQKTTDHRFSYYSWHQQWQSPTKGTKDFQVHYLFRIKSSRLSWGTKTSIWCWSSHRPNVWDHQHATNNIYV